MPIPTRETLKRLVADLRRALQSLQPWSQRLRRSAAIINGVLYRIALPSTWLGRALFVSLAIGASLAVVLLAWMADLAAEGFHYLLGFGLWLPVVLMPAGFALCAWITRRWFPGIESSGIPQTIAQIHLTGAHHRGDELLGFRRALGKLFLTPLPLLFGASSGREGPSVFVAAALMQAGRRWSVIRRLASDRQLLVAGGSVGIAAAFNTPLGGIMFAIEELSHRLRFQANSLTLSAVVMAGLCSLALMGNYLYFGRSQDTLDVLGNLHVVIVCGVLGGAGGSAFCWLALNWQRLIPRRLRALHRRKPVQFAALCGLAAGLLALFTAGMLVGSGYDEARRAVTGVDTLPLWYMPLKVLATLLSFMSGIPAGIFAPSLSIGAGTSSFAALLLPDTPTGVLALLCMVAYLAALTHAPITAFTIVMEMTGHHGLLIPLMAAGMIGQMTSRLLRQPPIYHALAERILRRIRLAERRAARALRAPGQSASAPPTAPTTSSTSP
ncbi:chloride channel protein [Uliginosibacterium sp. H1]|uniref:chloride channel protein n=1 Tax=Uliginosibacterium sp. H1 TaxID=3114757 RepID=UPI002E183E66|nr:chloride channel protein [Uliginosibacterium sp. H1]